MFGEYTGSGASIFLIFMGIAYILIIQYTSKSASQPRKLNDAELLVKLALIGPHSEYDIFRLAAGDWHVPESQIDGDFKTYLNEGFIPYYVNSYVRKKGKEQGDKFTPPFSPQGRNSLPWLK